MQQSQRRPKAPLVNPDLYSSIIVKSFPVNIPVVEVKKYMDDVFKDIIANEIEGTCIVEGYVKPRSVRVLHYSSGLANGPNVRFEVTFECLVCNPVAGQEIKCVVQTKNAVMGITATVQNEVHNESSPSPLEVFVLRDYSYNSKIFQDLNPGDSFTGIVNIKRFELKDKAISVFVKMTDED
jgi:hypothetical protein